MACKRCKSKRIAGVNAKCSDCCYVNIGDNERDGYVPKDIGISDNEDYIDFSFCLDCGQIQGKFPLKPTKIEIGGSEDDNIPPDFR